MTYLNTLITVVIQPIGDVVVKILGYVPTLFIAVGVLFIGWIISRTLQSFFVKTLKAIGFDSVADKLEITHFLKTGGIKYPFSEVLGKILYWTLIIAVVITVVKTLGLVMVTDYIDTLLVYIPHVLSGAIILILGMLLAKLVSTLIYVAAKNTDMPIPSVLRRLSKLAIVVYATILFLKEVGFVSLFDGTHYTILIGGVVFAAALAFGIAGKDIASKYLDVLSKKNGHE